VDQHHNNSENYFLWTLLANPATDAHLYAYNLQELVRDYPQSGILQALLAHASEEKNLKQASAYFNPKSLYKLINSPSGFTRVADDNIIIQPNIHSTAHQHNGHNSYLHISEDVAEYPEGKVDHHSAELEELTVQTDHEHIADETEPVLNTNTAHEHHITDVAPEIESFIVEEGIENYATVEERMPPVDETVPSNPEFTHPEHVAEHHHAVVEEAIEHLFDSDGNMPVNSELTHAEPETEHHHEVVEEAIEHLFVSEENVLVNSELTHAEPEIVYQTPAEAPVEEKLVEPGETIPSHAGPVHETHEYHHQVTEEAIEHLFGSEGDVPENSELTHTEFHPVTEEKSIEEETFDEITGIESISIEPQTEYHSFDQEVDAHKEPESVTASPESTTTLTERAEHQYLSRYNDEKMPYTFMWWLDKTRKDHSNTYQPYTKFNTGATDSKIANAADELQQQYYENIFHISSVEELDKSTASQTGGADMKLKEHVIIERFIQEEPQIKPQSSEKLDNENKAKKSSEDRDELVTETLAVIYTDQMLYHKAIASYKKLMLKFPEKSRYFAGKIEQLEKKTN
jgi:hypothetical protein